LSLLPPVQSGRQYAQVAVKGPEVIFDRFLSILGPAVQQVQHAEGRVQSYQKVIALSLASLNFESENGRFPADADELRDQFESQDFFVDSVNGRDIEIDLSGGRFHVWYHCELSSRLDIKVEFSER
jgi:hypothetical protein